MPRGDGTGPTGAGPGSGRGRGQMGGRLGGPGGRPGETCICAICGAKVPHERGVPCNSLRCPKCDAPLTRAR